MDEELAPIELTLFAAIEILATGTELPDERFRSAWMRVQQIQTSALPPATRRS
jgi:hypothetical protein